MLDMKPFTPVLMCEVSRFGCPVQDGVRFPTLHFNDRMWVQIVPEALCAVVIAVIPSGQWISLAVEPLCVMPLERLPRSVGH